VKQLKEIFAIYKYVFAFTYLQIANISFDLHKMV